MGPDGAVARHRAVILPGALVDMIVIKLDVTQVFHSISPEHINEMVFRVLISTETYFHIEPEG